MDERSSQSASLKSWMRGCAIAMGALGLYVLVSGPWSWWRTLLAVLLLACPVTAIWVALKYGRATPNNSTKPSSPKES